MIDKRKKDHIQLCVEEDVTYAQANGFDAYQLKHNALPEVDYQEVQTNCRFLNQDFDAPLMISSMTGGYLEGGKINAQLATIAKELNIPMGLGSMRIVIEQPDTLSSFQKVRDIAPEHVFYANIGGVQLAQWHKEGVLLDYLTTLMQCIQANGLIVHLNPLQELVQPEGDTNFKGVLRAIDVTRSSFDLPIIVKETGAGISDVVAENLLSAGVQVIDIAGAGGVSWSKVERLRRENRNDYTVFDNWGIPTAHSLEMVAKLKSTYDFKIIASGGLYSPLDMLKALALGADMCALAGPIIKILYQDGEAVTKAYLSDIISQLKVGLCLLGVKQPSELNHSHIYRLFESR